MPRKFVKKFMLYFTGFVLLTRIDFVKSSMVILAGRFSLIYLDFFGIFKN